MAQSKEPERFRTFILSHSQNRKDPESFNTKHGTGKIRNLLLGTRTEPEPETFYKKITVSSPAFQVHDQNSDIGDIKLRSVATMNNIYNFKGSGPFDKKPGIYRVDCGECSASYIGQAGQNFKKRVAEHKHCL